MSESLVLECNRNGGWHIMWVIDGDEGATLGESTYTARDLKKASPDDRDHILATITAAKCPGARRINHDGYCWQSKTQASAALKVVRLALKSDTGAAWPEWTIAAIAAGWRAPKGWKP